MYYLRLFIVVLHCYGHLCPYGLRLFDVVLQELPNCLHTYIIRVRGCCHVAKFLSTTISSF